MNSKAIQSVLAERKRQQTEEGWTAEHDDQHDEGELAAAGACFANPIMLRIADVEDDFPLGWPQDWIEWWKPKDRRYDLVRAAALIIAEIERLDRAEK